MRATESGFSPAHHAVEMGDLDSLGRLLDAGADIHEEHYGLTLLHHAVDAEIQGFNGTGELRVDTTAFLLARGADPTRRSGRGTGVSAEHMAFLDGHVLALELFEEWKRQRGT